MKRAYLFFTKFNQKRVYEKYLSETVKNSIKNLGFPGLQESIIQLYFDKNIKSVDIVKEDIVESNQPLCICISDRMTEYEVVINTLFKNLKDYNIYCYFHNSNEAMKNFTLKSYEQCIVKHYSFSHLEVDYGKTENPFYALAILTKSASIEVFYENLFDIQNKFLGSDVEISETDILNKKLKLLYKLLGNNYSDITKEEYKELKQEYEDLPDFPDEIDDEFIRQVRDLILDKTF